ncbi:MAG: hypothetical protein V3U80_01990 [Flavobacteriaceae bacterium]
MKKIITIAILFIAALSMTAQHNYRLGQYYEGYIVNLDGEKVRGYLKYQDESQRYKKVIFKTDKKAKKQKFKPKQLKAYKVAGEVFHSVAYKDVLFKNIHFLLLSEEGCINTYSFGSFNSKQEWETKLVIAKGDEAYTGGTFLMGFSKKFSKFISENTALAKKVKNKEKGYKVLSILKIVKEYNAACTK